MKTALQKFGKFLSAMVMPNIGAFIAWGFITALFIADGWLPNEQLASIQPYMLTYLLPILIAATGGKMIAKGVEYQGGQHGFARDVEHTLTRQTEDTLTAETWQMPVS